MTKPELVNNIDHRNLRVETAHGAEYGDAIMCALTFPAEFRSVQAHYPIVFQKDDRGGFHPVALFGLQAEQNLFLTGSRWDAHYVPLAVERQPFVIGIIDGEPMIHVDVEHPRVLAGTGQPVFRDHGGTTEYLEHVNSMLRALHEGLQDTPAFVDALLRHKLLESFVLDVQHDDGNQSRLVGYYTINRDRLRALDADTLGKLSAAGYLEPIYMIIASMSRLRDLIERQRRVAPHA